MAPVPSWFKAPLTPAELALLIAYTYRGLDDAFKSAIRLSSKDWALLGLSKETIGDIDLLCVADDAAATVARFTAFDDVHTVLASGDTKGSVTVALNAHKHVQVDLRVVDNDAFGAALQYFTGSKEHNVRLRERAVKKGWRLNEYGLWDGDTRIAGQTEEQVYERLGVPFIPPELREERGGLTGDAPPPWGFLE